MISLVEIFRKETPPAVVPRVPVRRAYQEKPQQVNQEITHQSSPGTSNAFTNGDSLRVPIPFREPGIQFPATWITLLRESGIYFQT